MKKHFYVTARYAIGTFVAFSMITMMIVTAYAIDRAEKAEAHAVDLTDQLTSVKSDLAIAEAQLATTQDELATTEDRLTTTSRSLDRASKQRSILSRRNRTCRYLVRINDRLLFASVAYGRATDHLMQNRNVRAGRALDRAARHARAVQAVIERSGYRSISGLVNDCAPPRQ